MNTLPQSVVDLQKQFPVRWQMRRRYRLPTDDPDQPFYSSWHPGGGIFGEVWDRFDTEGVLFIGRYNPNSIAAYALYCYERLHAGEAAMREPMLHQTAYLLRAQRDDGAFPYAFALKQYGLEPGWISGIAQGKAAAALWRAYRVTRERRYLEAATRALLPLTRDIAQGGTALLNGSSAFFEEISANPTHILNGHLTAAFAVWEACKFGFAPPDLAEIHNTAIHTLLRLLPHYDAGGWSYYQLALRDGGERHLAPIPYHQTHIAQLHVYHAMTGHNEFLEMSRAWREGMSRWSTRARVWQDGVAWLFQTAVRRVAKRAPSAWRPLPIERIQAGAER